MSVGQESTDLLQIQEREVTASLGRDISENSRTFLTHPKEDNVAPKNPACDCSSGDCKNWVGDCKNQREAITGW
jgi:hypothetical protein